MTEIIKPSSTSKILLVRVDGIGDLVLTMPADQAFQPAPGTWLIQKGLKYIAEHAEPKRDAYEVDLHFTFSRFLALVSWIKKQNFQAAVVFHAPAWIYFALWVARIPIRTGRNSQWFSFLLLNHGVRQSRKDSKKNELDYNCELSQSITGRASRVLPLRIKASSESLISGDYIIVHAGMKGSAKNWPAEQYIKLIKQVSKEYRVVMTGTDSDKVYLEPIQKGLYGVSNVEWLVGRMNSKQLLATLAGARCVVAPSTGVLHLAASLGTPVVGIYSYVHGEGPERWGPKGDHVKTIVPKSDSMLAISPESVLDLLRANKRD